MPNSTARGPRPSAAIRNQYQDGLTKLIEEMINSIEYWLTARYNSRANEIVAQDASPSRELEKELTSLFAQWGKRFNDYAKQRSRWFGKRINTNTTNQLRGSLRSAGITVKFLNSRRINNMLQAIVAENTRLIKSIVPEFATNVTSLVMQSVQNGRDMGLISKEIRQYLKPKEMKRAITIARDQTNKATEAISYARCEDIGVQYGFWMHRSGSKVPRSTHVAMNNKRFKLSEGLYDSAVGRKVKPAELINCHCTFRLDLSSISNTIAMDSKHGIMRVNFAAAIIEWKVAA